MSGIAESLAQLFYLKGLTLPTEQIIALIDGAIAGSPSGRGEAAIFTVINTDPSYQNVGVNCVITDIRIIGKQDYPVSSTQLNCEFDPDELFYNAADGKLTIYNFNLMNGKHITIQSLGASIPGNFDTVLSRLTKQERLTALIEAGTVFIWDVTTPIPAGFVEVTDYTGRFMVGVDGAYVPWNQVGKIGGQKQVTLTENEIPAISVPLFSAPVNGSNGDTPGANDHVARARSNNDNDSSAKLNYEMSKSNVEPTVGRSGTVGGGQAFDIIPDFKTVRYIRYAG